MILVIAAVMIWLACFNLYAVSTKQIQKTRQSRYAFMAQHPKWIKLNAVILLLSTILLLRTIYSSSISFIALWVLISPILLFFIINVNSSSKIKR